MKRLWSTLVCLSVLCATVQAEDWAHWRGPNNNGQSAETGLPDKWSPKGENLLWHKAEYASRSTPVVMNDRVYVVCRAFPETNKEGEKTVCVDAKTGNLLWESVHNIYLSDAPAERVGWSSVVADPETDTVFVLGLGCVFQCLDGKTGKTRNPFRQSSFMSRVISKSAAAAGSSLTVPQRSVRMQIDADCLAMVDGGRDQDGIAKALMERYPQELPTYRAALDHVVSLMTRYA